MDTSIDPTTPTVPAMRASDADRMTTVLTLQEAVVRGLLTSAEGDERSTAAFATTHRHELAPLTADLPSAATETQAGNNTDRPACTRWSGVTQAVLTCWLVLISAIARLPRSARIAAGLLLVLLVLLVLAGFGRDGFGGDGFGGPGTPGGPGTEGFRGRRG